MLLTRAPLDPKISFDLHVLGMPPAFILSQDQTLRFDGYEFKKFYRKGYLTFTLKLLTNKLKKFAIHYYGKLRDSIDDRIFYV